MSGRAAEVLLADDLRLAVVPVLLGGGLSLLPDGVSGADQSPSAGPGENTGSPHQRANGIPEWILDTPP